MTQPSEWATNLLEAKKQAKRIDETNAELKVRDERMLHSKAPELCGSILEKLKADCELFNYCMSDIPSGETMGQPGVRLQASGDIIRTVTALFDLNGHRIRVVRSHIRNGVAASDGKEFIEMKLMENDGLVLLAGDDELYTIEQVTNRIIESLLT